jgi:hypothetical protein
METKAGRYYGRTPRGQLVPVGDVSTVPDCVICRRVEDFAPAPVPTDAAMGTCAECGRAIAFNPDGPHPDVVKVCMQCRDITPLPIPMET